MDSVRSVTEISYTDRPPSPDEKSEKAITTTIELFKKVWTNVFCHGTNDKLGQLFRRELNPNAFHFYDLEDGQLKTLDTSSDALLGSKKDEDDQAGSPLAIYLGQSERRHVYAFRTYDDVKKFNRAKAEELRKDPLQKFQYLALTVDNMETKSYEIPAKKVVSAIWLLLEKLGQGMSSSGVLALLTLLSGLAAGTAVFCLPALLVSLGFLVTGAALLWLYNRYALPPA